MGKNTLTYKQSQNRERKAREIVAEGGVYTDGREGRYYVASQNGAGAYTVDAYAGTCECPDHEYRGAYCKHLRAAEIVEARDAAIADRDPFEPDWEALAREEPISGYADSRDAAGLYNPTSRGLSEAAWEYGDYAYDSRIDRL